MAIGKKAEVPEFGKAPGKDVHQETADELVSMESHRSFTVVFFAIFPLEGYIAVLKCHQSVV